MTYREAAGSGIMYIAVIIALLIVVGVSVVYLRKCYKHALECGIEKQILSNIIRSSAVFAVVPAIGIVVGMIALSTLVGLPYGWLRLSVMGSLSYETMAANMALEGLGVTDVATSGVSTLAMVMFTMSLPMAVCAVNNVFFGKKVHMGSVKMQTASDKRWGAASSSVFMNALLLVMMTPHIMRGGVSLATFITAAVLGFIITTIAKKYKIPRLGEFAMAICLLGSMTASYFYSTMF